MASHILPLLAALCAAACSDPGGGAASRADTAEPSFVIAAPPQHELDAALASISDPQLAAQVAADGDYAPAECVVHIGQIDPVPAGAEAALDAASAAWRRRLAEELGETGAAQMIGSSVNMLQPTPPPLRQAAVAWCLANAPQ